MTQSPQKHPLDKARNSKRFPRLIWVVSGSIFIAIFVFIAAALFILQSQGVTQGTNTLTPISIVIGIIIGLVGLLLAFLQWYSARPVDVAESVRVSQLTNYSIAQEMPVTPLSQHLLAASMPPPLPLSLSETEEDRLYKKQEPTKKSSGSPRVQEEWGDAPYIEQFYGREQECMDLVRWIVDERVRMVALLGIGGIGKTSLASVVARQIKDDFDYVFWCSLQNAQPLDNILGKTIAFFSDQQQVEVLKDVNSQLGALINYLQNSRCLLVLDNFDAILQGGDHIQRWRDGYEEYGKLIRLIGETPHQSCLLITSREKPEEITHIEGSSLPVRTLQLAGLENSAGQKILEDKGVIGSSEAYTALIYLYAGNPLALKVVSEPILDLFGGDASAFLKEEKTVVGSIYDLLDQQFKRLSILEQESIYWLAVERKAVTLGTLQENIVHQVSKRELLAALESLRRRSMIESIGSALFGLQPVITEYVTERFIDLVCKDIQSEEIGLFGSHALIKAQSEDHVRNSQVRLILVPVIEWLLATMGKKDMEERLKNMLGALRQKRYHLPSYLAGNTINLLLQAKSNLSGYNFSSLMVWQAYLQGVNISNVNFAYAAFRNTVFTDMFGSILSLSLSFKDDLLAAGTASGEIRVWNFSSSASLRTCQGHTDWANSVAFSPDGETIVSGSDDQSVRIWNASTGESLKVLLGHTSWVYSVAFSPDGRKIASGSHDRSVRVWNASTGECLKVLHGDSGMIYSIAFSPDGETIASVGEDQCLRIWNASTGEPLKVFQGHTGWTRGINFSVDGGLIASGSHDLTIRIWNVETGECLQVLRGHTQQIRSVVFSPDGQFLASGSQDQSVRIWEVSSGKCLRTLQGHTGWVRSVVFSPDGSTLVSGSDDQSIRVWEMSTGESLRMLLGYSSGFYSVAYSAVHALLVTGGEDYRVRIWDVKSGKCLNALQGHTNRVWSVALSSNGKVAVSGSDDQSVRLWDVDNGRCLRTLLGHKSWVYSVSFNPNGNTVASGSDDQMVYIWEVSSGKCLKTLQGHTSWVRSVAFSPDGSQIASGSNDQSIRLWDATTGICLSVLQEHSSWVSALAFSPNGKLIASGSNDQSVRLWDVKSGRCLTTLDGHTGWVRSVAFSLDGDILVSGSEDQSIRVWNVETGVCIRTLKHDSCITSVTFCLDRNIIASSSEDGIIKLWDIQSGEPLRQMRPDRPYEMVNITGATGLTEAQKKALKALGAVEV
jgi:WD40 repeat protein